MKILALGSCISLSIIRMLKMEAVFDNSKIIYDKLPWNFWDGSIELKEGNNLTEQEKSKVRFLMAEIPKETMAGSDYIIIDLYTLSKTIVRLNYSGKNKVVAVDLPLLCTLNKIDNLFYEKVDVGEEFVYESLEKFSCFLKEIYSQNQIVIIRPKLARRYLDENMNVREAIDLQERINIEDKVLNYTDYLIKELGQGVNVYDISSDVIGECQSAPVHYTQADYIRIEDDILKMLNIDYSQYWKHDLNPEELVYEYWIRKSNEFFSIAKSAQKLLFSIDCEELTEFATPVRMKAKSKGLYSQWEMLQKSLEPVVHGRSLVCFGAGQNCQRLLEKCPIEIEFILDNDREKEGQTVKDILIKNPSAITEWTEYFILITCAQTNDIEKQLNSYGLQKGTDYVLLKEMM